MRLHVIVFAIFSLLMFLTIPTQSGADVINACKNDRNGQLRIVDDVDDCRPSESPLSWNTEGPQGEPGEPGLPGGFDVNRLYVVTCGDDSQCQCEDRGGRHFISGNVNCGLCDNSTQASLSTTNYLEGTETFEAFCNCADLSPPVSHYTVPLYIQLICYDNSE